MVAPPEGERARIRAALLGLLAERPYEGLAEADLVAAAALTPAELAAHYESLDACFTELCQGFLREAAELTFAAYAAEDNWRDGMRAQIWAAHDFLAADRLRARVCVVDINFAGDGALAIRDLFMGAFTELVHLGRHQSPAAERVVRERAEAFAGASWEMIAVPIRSGAFDRLLAAVPRIIYMLYLPYLGQAEARAELARARAEAGRRSAARR